MTHSMEKLHDEEKRMRRLRFVVDLSVAILMQAELTLREAFNVVDDARKAALALFPGSEDKFDLIYLPRFKRIIRERFVIPGGRA
jgi:hypothetical protein